MELHILLAGVEFGPYTDDKARQLLGDGFLSATDPAKRLDGTDWQPLSDVLGDPPESPHPFAEDEPVQEDLSAPSEEISSADEPSAEPAPTAAWPRPAPAFSAAPPQNFPPAPATPKLQVSMPSRNKKAAQATRTGSLLAMEALHAAQDRSPVLAPTRPILSNATAPVPELEPEPAPPRRRTPVKLGPQPEEPPAAAPPQRKAIKLTGRIGVTAVPPPPEKPAPVPPSSPRSTTSPRLPTTELAKFSGLLSRPGTAPIQKAAPPERQSGPLVVGDRRETSPIKPPSRKTIQLSGPISLPGRPAGPTPPAARAPRQDDDDGPMVMARISRPIGKPTGAPKEPVIPTRGEPPTPSASSPATPTEPLPETAGETHTSSGSLSAELAARRSLKITGSLRQFPPAAGPIQLGSTSGESGPLPPVSGERASFAPPAGLEPAAPWPSPPVPEEDLPNRPPTGKIPVNEMPTEGVRVRTTRRLTSKVPLPATPTESLTYESPPRPLPPPLPQDKIELPAAPALDAPSAPATEPFSQGEPMSREEFAAASALAEEPGAEFAPPEAAPEEPPAPEAPAAIEAAAAATETLPARPEKARLRRPVKLELTSRPKPDDSGRITLAAFSKMAGDAGVENPPAAPAEEQADPGADPVHSEVGVDPAAAAPTKPARSSAPRSNFPKRLEETAPAWKTPRQSDAKPPSLLWLLYAIVVVGLVAGCVIIYLLMHRPSTEVTPAEAAAPASVVPSSAAPPANAAPPASAAPPANVAPPAAASTTPAQATPAPPPAAPAPAPAPSNLPNVQEQAAAFVSDGILKYQHGDLDGAIAAYNQALNLDPKSAEAYYNRGIAKAAHDDLDGAIADYSQALQADPTLAAAYYYRGLARHSKDELDGAIADYNQAVQMDPKNALAFFNRGLIRMQEDDIDGAIVDSTQALQLDPHLIQSYYNRGLGRLAKGAMDASLDDMRTFCQLAPQDAYTNYARLYIWLIQTREGQLADANSDLSKAMNSGWNGTPDSMVTRIGEYLLGQISEAELIKSSASAIPVKDQGQRCEAWYFIGMRKLVEGDQEAAIEALRKCVATQKLDYCEYILAQEQLRNLAGGASSTPPPPPRATPVGVPDPGTVTPDAGQ